MNQRTSATEPFLIRQASNAPFWTMLAGGLLLFCSFPPPGLAWLAWLALVPWLALIATPAFSGSRPWLKIWLGGLIFQAASVYYIPIPHWMLWFGWLLLFVYLSVYPILFVWLGRIMVHDHRVPLVIAAPLVFTALEWVRAHMITGWGAMMLANSQVRYPRVLQICDLAGGYGLTFLMVMVSVAVMFLMARPGRHWKSMVAGVAALGVVLVYGQWRYADLQPRIEAALQSSAAAGGFSLDALVVQGAIDTRFPENDTEREQIDRQFFREYLDLQRQWTEQREPDSLPEVIFWPEGKYPVPLIEGGQESPQHRQSREDFRRFHRLLFAGIPLPPPLVTGVSVFGSGGENVYNSAILLNPDGTVGGRYDKMHRVLFGEYVPFSGWFPVLARLTPIGAGLTPGEAPESFVVGETRIAPNICFESIQTHLVREQLNTLATREEEPDVLLNLTDDGWFYGSALLDHHLACNVLRAVELRKPVVVAANTGLSALIDASGRIRVEGERRKREVLRIQVPVTRGLTSWYRTVGDWPAIFMTLVCVLAILTRRRGRGRRPAEAAG